MRNAQLTRKLAICVRYGKWCQRFLGHQLAWESVNSVPNNILDAALMLYVKMSFISTFSLFSVFQAWFYQTRWFYPYLSFKYSKWWRHKLSHT